MRLFQPVEAAFDLPEALLESAWIANAVLRKEDSGIVDARTLIENTSINIRDIKASFC
jgi:hypothetical protein